MGGGAYYFGLIKKGCGTSEDCFLQASARCRPATFQETQEIFRYAYAIHGWRGNTCKLTVHVTDVALGADVKVRDSFTGKAMACYVPQEAVESVPLNELSDILPFCSGPLKEAFYEQAIEKLYGLILQNMGTILTELEKDLPKLGAADAPAGGKPLP